jgi:hypothetical protein
LYFQHDTNMHTPARLQAFTATLDAGFTKRHKM